MSAPAIQQVITDALNRFDVHGMVVAITRGASTPAYTVLGSDGAGRPLSEDSLFPVASLTKLATALAVLRLADQEVWEIADPVARYLPDSTVAQEGITLRSLLAHTSGLPFFYDRQATPWNEQLDWPTIARACLQTPPIAPPGTRVIYSNVDYALLAIAAERVTGQPFPATVRALVFEPLGIEAYLGDEPPRQPAVIVDVEDPHRGTPLEQRNSPFYRALALPYAGVLTTAAGALGLIRAFEGEPQGFLRPETAAEARIDQTGGLSGGPGDVFWSPCPWGLGPEVRGAKKPHWTPQTASADSFGHAGGSGCLVWSDPARNLRWAILGTRAMDGSWAMRAFPRISAAILEAE